MSDGSLILVGGSGENLASLNTAETFDFETGQWSPTASMPSAVGQHQAVALTGRRVLVAGGWRSSSTGENSTTSRISTHVMLYRAENDTWETIGSPWPNFSPNQMVLLNGGRVLAVEGSTWGIFDSSTESWTQQGRMTTSGGWEIAPDLIRVLPDGQILVGETGWDEPVLVLYDATLQNARTLPSPGLSEPTMAFVEERNEVVFFSGQKVGDIAQTVAVNLTTFTVEERKAIYSNDWIEWSGAISLEGSLVLLLPDFWNPYRDALALFDAANNSWSKIDSPVTRLPAGYPPIRLNAGSVLIFDMHNMWLLNWVSREE